MPAPNRKWIRVWEDGSAILMTRFEFDGAPSQKADYGTITYAVYDVGERGKSEPTVVVGVGGSQTVSTIISDTLKTNTDDPRWTEDESGYNCLIIVPPAAFPTGGHRYWIDIKHTHSDGTVGWDCWEASAEKVAMS